MERITRNVQERETLSSYKCNLVCLWTIIVLKIFCWKESISFIALFHKYLNWRRPRRQRRFVMFISKWFRLVHELRLPVPYMNEGYWSMSANVRLFRISPPTACESLRFTFNWILIHISEHIIRIVKSTQFTISRVWMIMMTRQTTATTTEITIQPLTVMRSINFHCSLR